MSEAVGVSPILTHLMIEKAVKFLRDNKLDVSPKNTAYVYHGLHSNIPECCILFWLVFWKDILSKVVFKDEENVFRRFRVGYIICPHCRIHKNIVKIHRCNDSCPKHEEIKSLAKEFLDANP